MSAKLTPLKFSHWFYKLWHSVFNLFIRHWALFGGNFLYKSLSSKVDSSCEQGHFHEPSDIMHCCEISIMFVDWLKVVLKDERDIFFEVSSLCGNHQESIILATWTIRLFVSISSFLSRSPSPSLLPPPCLCSSTLIKGFKALLPFEVLQNLRNSHLAALLVHLRSLIPASNK